MVQKTEVQKLKATLEKHKALRQQVADARKEWRVKVGVRQELGVKVDKEVLAQRSTNGSLTPKKMVCCCAGLVDAQQC